MHLEEKFADKRYLQSFSEQQSHQSGQKQNMDGNYSNDAWS